MKYSAAVLALAATVLATTTKDLPPCSRKTLEHGVIAGGCKTSDFACSCTRADLLAPILIPHVQRMCSEADVDRAITVVEGICLNAGIPVSIPRPAPVLIHYPPVKAPSSSAPVQSIIRSSVHVPTPSSVRVPDISISLPTPTHPKITVTISEPLPTPVLPSIVLPSTCELVTVTHTVTLRPPPVPSVVVPSIVVPSIVVPSIVVPSIVVPSIISPPYPTTNVTAPLPIGTNPVVPSSVVPVTPISTRPAGTGVVPSVTASQSRVPSAVPSGYPAFTGAAMALKVPAALFGLMGFAALL